MNKFFLDALRKNEWTETPNNHAYEKGEWTIVQDTGSWWIILNSKTNFRGFDFPEPTDETASWTINLIEHLCELYEQTFA